MTEYWVSQGNKWCDFCKIFISNNPSSIRNHELGQRHKDSVAKRLDSMRKEGAAKEKEKKEAARALQQIETKAKRSYQKDIETFRQGRDSNASALDAQEDSVDAPKGSGTSKEWEYESSSGYYYNLSNGYYYDPNSGFYYSDATGKWVTHEEAFATSDPKQKGPIMVRKSTPSLQSKNVSENKDELKLKIGPAPGPVVSAALNPMRSVKGAATSSLTLSNNKRKRPEEKPKVLSKEEAAAIKAREAAKKRVEEREKPLLGLYGSR